MAMLAGRRRSSSPSRPGQAISVVGAEMWVPESSPVLQFLVGPDCFQVGPDEARTPEPGEQAVELNWGRLHLVVRTPEAAGGPVAAAVAQRGGTVRNVALVCADPTAVAARASKRGLAVSYAADGWAIDLFGDGSLHHTARAALPTSSRSGEAGHQSGAAIDHIALCLSHGLVGEMVDLYEDVFGLTRLEGGWKETGDEANGMRSVVLSSDGGLTVVLVEPLRAAGRGQVQRFLEAHRGSGVQHLAIGCSDILGTVQALRHRGMPFLSIPGEHHERSRVRLGRPELPWDALRRADVVVDADDGGLLYQAFTQPLTDRNTFFLELIQRDGATGFGAGNVEALFAAVDAAAERARPTIGKPS